MKGSNGSPPLLIPRLAANDEAMRLGLPAAGDNLFGRIISNPAPAGLPPRERACTEMLCAVLRNASALRCHLLQALAATARVGPIQDLGQLEYDLRTEASVPGGKRDDLRIEAWRDRERKQRTLLWSFEIKVGSPFHCSARSSDDADDSGDWSDAPWTTPEPENQLLHYDRWLSHEAADSVEGFVLCRSSSLRLACPSGLSLAWPCITWTWLGLTIEAALTGDLPAEERLLVRHLAGFIRSFLWNDKGRGARGYAARHRRHRACGVMSVISAIVDGDAPAPPS